MATCKECRYFIQGKGHSGTCEKRPYVSTRQGTVSMGNGKPRKLYVTWGKNACKLFERGDSEMVVPDKIYTVDEERAYKKGCQDTAEKIFEDIEDVINNIGYFDEIDFLSLKKKYTESEGKE